MPLLIRLHYLFIVLCIALNASIVKAEELSVSQNTSGVVGLIEMPSARMYPEGEFTVHLTKADPYWRMVVLGQPLDWLQVLFKYTDIGYQKYGYSGVSSSQNYKDKSVDVKARLWKEQYYIPEISVGFDDVGGTGLFSGEYLVASKQIKNMDFTLGMGWGYLGSRGQFTNPFTLISSHFKSRTGSAGHGGNIDYFRYFSGEKVSLFGGAEYHLESIPLSLKVEYDGNDYQHEPFGHMLKQDIPLNIGMVYSPNRYVNLHLGYERGNTVSLGFTLKTNLKSNGVPKILDPKPIAVDYKPPRTSEKLSQVVQEINDQSGYSIDAIYENKGSLVLKGKQNRYQENAKAYGRAARVLATTQPKKIKKFVLVDENKGLDVFAVNIDRKAFESAARLEENSDVVLKTTQFSPNYSISEFKKVYDAKPSPLNYSLSPYLSGSYGGPEAFVLYQLGVNLNAEYAMNKNIWATANLQLGLLDNYDKFKDTSNSVLPHVRTDIKKYLKSKLRMANLQLTMTHKLAKDWFVMGYAGYLETMFGGVGAETLYRPYDKNWALGLDLNYVKQRAFDKRFTFQNYSVKTGHLTAYYETNSHILAKVSAGQYLAGDRGMTIDLSKGFRSGARLGVWVTKTNVSAAQFGEGSFDKGFYLTIPFNQFSYKSTKVTGSMVWQFLTRDGGARLHKAYNLYDLTDDRRMKFVEESFDHVLD